MRTCRILTTWVVTASVLLLGGVPVSADVPGQMSYQGFLRDSAGEPVSGFVNMQFYIHPDSAGCGTPGQCWGPETHAGVEVVDGFFELQLGSQSPLPGACFDGSVEWLEIWVNGLALCPRKPISSSAYAFMAPGVGDTVDCNTCDDVFVNEGQASSISLGMMQTNSVNSDKIQNGSLLPEDLGFGTVVNGYHSGDLTVDPQLIVLGRIDVKDYALNNMVAITDDPKVSLTTPDCSAHVEQWVTCSSQRIQIFNSSNVLRIEIKSGNIPEVKIFNSSGQERATLGVNSSGCGFLTLTNQGGAQTIDFDACNPLVEFRNTAGDVTFQLDRESGDVFYAGALRQLTSAPLSGERTTDR